MGWVPPAGKLESGHGTFTEWSGRYVFGGTSSSTWLELTTHSTRRSLASLSGMIHRSGCLLSPRGLASYKRLAPPKAHHSHRSNRRRPPRGRPIASRPVSQVSANGPVSSVCHATVAQRAGLLQKINPHPKPTTAIDPTVGGHPVGDL